MWEGEPGATVAFVVTNERKAWLQVWAVAANPEGVLRRLAVGGPALFGQSRQEVPEVSDNFIANAVRQRTFTDWLERHATVLHGMAVVVGRSLSPLTFVGDADRVYTVITLPPEPYTFKLVIGWRTEYRKPSGN